MRQQMPTPLARHPGAVSALLLAVASAAAGCEVVSVSQSPPASAAASATPGASLPEGSEPARSAPPRAELPLSLGLPDAFDPRRIRVSVQPELPAGESGELIIVVTNLSDTMVAELVLRWPTALEEVVFLAPFRPSQQRIREGGPVLNQEWTKWVIGPGESGEPAGTTSLGWGPLLAGATLTIPLVADRRGAGPVEFDLQFLAGEAILTLDARELAELRVALP